MSAPSPRVLPVGCGYRLTFIKPNPGLRYFPLATLRCAPSDAAARLQGPHVVRPGGTQLVPVGAVVRERSGRTRRQPTQYTKSAARTYGCGNLLGRAISKWQPSVRSAIL